MKLSHYEAALSDREHQYCLISGVVAWNIGGLEQQHRQKCKKERVKWQERITTISVSTGSSKKMAEVGVTAWKSTNLSEEGVTTWKSAKLSEEGVTSWKSTEHYIT